MLSQALVAAISEICMKNKDFVRLSVCPSVRVKKFVQIAREWREGSNDTKINKIGAMDWYYFL